MDFLTVAAAAGAGYVAKYLQKTSKENDGEPNSEAMNAVVQGRQENICDGSYTDLMSFRENVGWKMNIGAESTSYDGLGDLGRYQDSNLQSLASLSSGIDEREIFRLRSGNLVRDELRKSSKGQLPDSVVEEVHFSHCFPRGGRSIRSRRPYSNFAKPWNSLESCLTAQLYKHHSAMENCMHTPLPSPSLRIRPLLITDGKRVISRAGSEFQVDTRLKAKRVEDRIQLGAPRLPKRSMKMTRRPTDFQRRVKPDNGGQLYRKVNIPSATVDVEQLYPQGSRNGMHLFLLGVTIGILSTAVANKREMDRLNGLLKQTKNLVQDLQEEIEMKQSMTVKELVIEDVRIQESDGNIFSLKDPIASQEKLVDGEKYCSKEDDQTAKQSEIMSQIEAELEAELERLELNMKGSTLERIADLVELDPGYEADVAKGEFRIDTMNKRWIDDSNTDEDNKGSSFSGHTDYANRPVSPKELSLRLHEVIEARLGARIMELETALEDSQRRLHSLEHSSIKDKACTEKGSASPMNSSPPDYQNNFDQPLVIDLAGDALDAYNEAYEEIFRMVKTEDETPPDSIYNNNEVEPKTLPSQTQSQSLTNNNMPALQNICVEKESPIASIERVINWEDQLSENIESGDESGDDDILGKLLIQQIVEKTRQGSPLVLNAQRLLYSMDE